MTNNWPKIDSKLALKALLGLAFLATIILTLSLATTGQAAAEDAKAPANPPSGSSFKERLALRKDEFKPKLDKEARQHLSELCSQTQAVFSSKSAQIDDKLNKYNQAYQRIDGILIVNIGRLQLDNKSTFNLQKQETRFANETARFKALGEYYKQALDDAQVINCQADPVGFKALIETIRGYYVALQNQRDLLYDFTANEVKQTFKTYTDKYYGS